MGSVFKVKFMYPNWNLPEWETNYFFFVKKIKRPGLTVYCVPCYTLSTLHNLHLSSNNLATWCEEPTQWERCWCWERLEAGGGRGQKRRRWLAGISMGMSFSKLRDTDKDREPWGAAVHGAAKSQTRLSDWTPTTAHQNWKDRVIMPISSAMELRLHQVA